MDFKPGELTSAEARELNWLRGEVVKLSNLRVAGPTMRIYRGPANITIESIAAVPVASGSNSGSGGSGGSGSFPDDRVTVCFEALIDVGVEVTATCVAGVITTTTTVTKTFETVCITGPDLSIAIT